MLSDWRQSPRLVLAAALFIVNGGLLLSIWLWGFYWPVFALCAAASLILAVLNPFAALLAMLALVIVFAKSYTLQPVIINGQEYKFFAVDVLMLGIYTGSLLKMVKGIGNGGWRWSSNDVWLCLWLLLVGVYAWLSWLVWEGEPRLIISALKNYGFYPLLFFAVAWLTNSRRKLQELIVSVAAAALGSIGFLIYGLINGQGWGTEITPLTTVGARLLDFDHAFYMSLALWGVAAYWFHKPADANRRWWLLAAAMWLAGVIASLMRHLWLAGGITAALTLWQLNRFKLLSWRRFGRYFFVCLAVGLLLSGLLFWQLPDAAISRRLVEVKQVLWDRLTSLNFQDTSVSWRGAVWNSVWRAYAPQWPLGLGYGQKIFIEMPFYSAEVELRDIHNSWLAVLTQMGPLAFACLLIWWWSLCVKLLSAARQRRWINWSVGSMLLFCAIAFLFQPYLEANFFNIIFWSLAGVGRRLYEGFAS